MSRRAAPDPAEIGQQRDADGTQCGLSQYLAVVGREAAPDRHLHALVRPRTPERPGSRARAPQVMDAVVPLQIRRHGEHAVLGQVPRRGDQHRTYLADQRSHMRVGHLGHVPDRQVETLGGQRGQPVAQVQLDLHVRVALERRNQRRDDLPPQRHRRRHSQHAPGPGRQVLHGRVARLDALERGGGPLDQVRARLCQADAARGAPHQRQPDGLFQLGDALADRRC